MHSRQPLLVLLALTLLVVAFATPVLASEGDAGMTLSLVGTYDSGNFDQEAAEIVAYDPATKRMFVVNGGDKTVDILDASDPTNLTLLGQIDMTVYGSGANSVDAYDGVIAIAVEADDKQSNGSLVFVDSDGNLISQVEVGALPDMVVFTPDGSKALVANEGEPNDDYTVDPEGTVSIIDLSGGIDALTQDAVTTIEFSAYNDAELDSSIRIFGPEASVAQDIEPEAVTIGTIDDRTYAFVGLERAGGIMVFDVTDPTAPSYVTYFNNRDFDAPSEEAGDLAPEGVIFVPADQSPIGSPVLMVGNEFSGTTSIYSIDVE